MSKNKNKYRTHRSVSLSPPSYLASLSLTLRWIAPPGQFRHGWRWRRGDGAWGSASRRRGGVCSRGLRLVLHSLLLPGALPSPLRARASELLPRTRPPDKVLPASARRTGSSPRAPGRRAPPPRTTAGELLPRAPPASSSPSPPPAPDRRAPPRGRPVNEELLVLLPRMQPAEKLLPCMPSAIATTLIKI